MLEGKIHLSQKNSIASNNVIIKKIQGHVRCIVEYSIHTKLHTTHLS